MRRPIPPPEDPDLTLNQAAHMLTKKSSGGRGKKAPLPPKRTSSFKDHSQSGSVSSSTKDVSLPDTVLEDGQMDSLDHTPESLDNLEAADSVERDFHFLNDVNKSRSSSEELLSTPASHSHSGSMERTRERVLADVPRSRSSSRERSLSESSPAKTRSSSEQKTPDTDISEGGGGSQHPLPPPVVTFPPPPPPLVTTTEMSSQTPRNFYKPDKSAVLTEQVNVAQLRASLRKTKPYASPTVARPHEAEDSLVAKSLDHHQQVASLEERNVKQLISRYGTIPKGAHIGVFLASLEPTAEAAAANKRPSPEEPPQPWTNGRSASVPNESSMLPPLEVTRKVEEWKAGVARSLAEEKEQNGMNNAEEEDMEHNVKPSTLLRSSSSHSMTASTEKPPLSALFQRQKSDVSTNGTQKSPMGQPPEPAVSSIPEHVRPKPRPSPRMTTRRHADGPGGDESEALAPASVPAPASAIKPGTMPLFPARVPSTSSSEPSMETKSLETSESPRHAPNQDTASRKLSPPVPKKPLTPVLQSRSTRKDKSDDHVNEEIKVKPPWEKDKKDKKDKNKDKKNKLSPPPKDLASVLCSSQIEKKDSGSKFPFRKQDSSDKDSHNSPKGRGQKLPPGAKPTGMLAGSKQVLPPGSGQGNQGKPQIVPRPSLNKVETKPEKEKAETSSGDEAPLSKSELMGLSATLSRTLKSMQTPSGKHTSSIMALSEQVQTFTGACTTYADSLPPHKNFHFRELLSTLQQVADCLRTTPSGAPRNTDRLLQDLEGSIKDINTVLAR